MVDFITAIRAKNLLKVSNIEFSSPIFILPEFLHIRKVKLRMEIQVEMV